MSKYEVEFTPEAANDYDKLDGSAKLQVMKSVAKLEQIGMAAGEALHGRLSDCRKLKHQKLGLRVVFKENENSIEIIEVIVIGRRDKSEVYIEAERRLRR